MKRILIFFVALIVLLLGGYLGLRDYILNKAILSVRDKIDRKFGAQLDIGEAKFEGFARISFTDIVILPPAGDTLFYCSNSAVSFSLWRFIKGQPPVNNFIAHDGFIRLTEKADSSNNFSFILNKGDTVDVDSTEAINSVSYKKMASRLWNRFFGVSDFNFNITDFLLTWQAPNYIEQLSLDSLSLKETAFMMHASDFSGKDKTVWYATGTIDPSDEILNIEASADKETASSVPFCEKLTGIRMLIKSFSLSVSLIDNSSDELRLNVNAKATNPAIYHWRISPEEVALDSFAMAFDISVLEHEIKTDPLSRIVINQIPILTSLSYLKNDSTVIATNIQIESMSSQVFFNSLPKGLFSTLDGIKTKGELEYHLIFKANLDHPDDLIFDAGMKKKDFRITTYGNENFSAINNTFIHAVRENDRIVRVFQVGPENPMYVPLEQISPLMINSVLIAEDGTFRFHRGFNEEAFRQSIATNIKEKRFARGGSTITMQLVKNVFLHRNKTISRKVEEALIVWLIENNYIVSKDRMLEVYLNIIEWGPGIYGIGEASNFYFAKHPSMLTLEESIYLSSIIPRPKTFKYTFDKEGKMKDYLKGYFDVVANRLLKKEIITQQTRDSLHYTVELRGPALQLVVPIDSIPVDSLLQEENEELF